MLHTGEVRFTSKTPLMMMTCYAWNRPTPEARACTMEQVCVVSGVMLYAHATERRRMTRLAVDTDEHRYAKVGADDEVEYGEGSSLLSTKRP